MLKLVITTLIWAFSFSLIDHYISGKMDVFIAIFIRFLLAAMILLPFFNFKLLKEKISVQLIGIGALQIGLMYIAYFQAFEYITVSEVALFTVLTPLFVSLTDNIIKKHFTPGFFITSTIAVIGAAIIKWNNIDSNFILGFILVQLANLCFASGQVLYKNVMNSDMRLGAPKVEDREVFFLFYLGALLPVIPLIILKSDFTKMAKGISCSNEQCSNPFGHFSKSAPLECKNKPSTIFNWSSSNLLCSNFE